MGEYNSDDHYIYYCGQESLRRNGVALTVSKRVWNAVLGCNLKNDRMISVCFQGKPFNIMVIQVYVLTNNAEASWGKWKRRVKTVDLKLSIQETKTMAPGPITSCEIDGETVETVADFIFMGSKIIADGDCSHEIKRRLLLGRKVITNLDSILKSRDTTLPAKVHRVKAMFFPVVMYGCES